MRQDVLQHINEGFITTANTIPHEMYDKLVAFEDKNKQVVDSMISRWGQYQSPSMYKMLNISNMQFRNINLANEYKQMMIRGRHEE